MGNFKNIVLVTLWALNLCCSSNGGKITDMFDPDSEEKEKIKNILETTFLNVSAGTYSEVNDLPFYNQDAGTLMTIAFLPMLVMAENASIKPEKIIVYDVSADSANVTYDLRIIKKSGSKVIKSTMVVRKIGGLWKLDAKQFFSFKE